MTHPQHSTLITGSNSSQAAFSISYYVPSAVFRELYPDCGIRNVVIDIAPEQQTSFEKELNRLLANTNVAVTLRSDYQWNFRNALFHQQIIPLLIGCVLLLIGVLNFANALITKMLVRKKEFAIYESLGMTHKQLKCLLLSEGILYGGLLSILLLPSTTAVTWFWSHHWLQTTNTWCITYQYSILPLWIVLPLLIVLAIVIPLCCLRFITKESVTQRLRIID